MRYALQFSENRCLISAHGALGVSYIVYRPLVRKADAAYDDVSVAEMKRGSNCVDRAALADLLVRSSFANFEKLMTMAVENPLSGCQRFVQHAGSWRCGISSLVLPSRECFQPSMLPGLTLSIETPVGMSNNSNLP